MGPYFTEEEHGLLYEKFSASGQPRLRLLIAVEELLGGERLPEGAAEAYREYVRRRQPAARQLLKEEGGLLPLGQGELWRELTLQLCRKYPGWVGLFSLLKPLACQGDSVGFDGETLFYPESWAESRTLSDGEMAALFLHMVLHGLCLHFRKGTGRREDCWDLACDIYAEFLLEEWFGEEALLTLPEQVRRLVLPPPQDGEKSRKAQIFSQLRGRLSHWDTQSIYQYLCQEGYPQEWKPLFKRDDHGYWPARGKGAESPGRVSPEAGQRAGGGPGAGAAALCRERELLTRWRQAGRCAGKSGGGTGGQRGPSPGGGIQLWKPRKTRPYDYRQFLERFSEMGEEMLLDMDSFSYIPYAYSRAHYEKLVLLEPLEYREVNRLRELVIAVDTSGSCRGEIVRRFLDETWSILSRREHFFEKMRVHFIQCDSMIQGYTRIESQKEWEECASKLKLQGFGGTDFRPVFDLVEKLRAEKEIRNLKGLIYFTDGDGIYPRKAPDYDTAFVFLERALEKGQVPDWAYRLNLGEVWE